MTSRETELRQLLEPIVESQGLCLVEVGLGGGDGSSIVRLVVTGEGGVSHAECARVTRAVSAALDENDPIPGRYHLEVSSPGLNRVLKEEREFELFRGQPVRLRVADGDTVREVTGISDGVREGQGPVVVAEDGSESIIPWSRVVKARLDGRDKPAPGPGGKGR